MEMIPAIAGIIFLGSRRLPGPAAAATPGRGKPFLDFLDGPSWTVRQGPGSNARAKFFKD